MTIDGQTLAAVIVVALAAVYLSRQTMRFFRGNSRACGNCPSRTQTGGGVKSLPLVQLPPPKIKTDRGADA
jgi:hypothetical protein